MSDLKLKGSSKTTLKQLGFNLPFGVPDNTGALVKNFSIRPWRLKEEKELRKKYCPLLITRISTSHPQYASIDKVLHERGWQGPKNFLMNYHFQLQTFQPEWLAKAMEMPYADGVTEFFWKDLTEKEKEKLFDMEKKKAFPQGVNPFAAYGGPVEPLNSLGLRYKGEVIAAVNIAVPSIRVSLEILETVMSKKVKDIANNISSVLGFKPDF